MQMVSHKAAITRAMTLIGFLSLSLSDEISRDFLYLMGALTLLSLILITKFRFRIPGIVWNILAAVVLGLFTFNYLTQGTTFVASIASLTLILVVLKLFDLNKPRDHLFLYILVFFQLLASAVSTISPLFLLMLAAFIITSIWAMIVFTVQKDYALAGGDSEHLPKETFTFSFFSATIVMTVSTFIMTMMIFFLLPRVDLGLFEKKTANTMNVTGFSEGMDLGAIGKLKRNSAIVMRIGIGDSAEAPWYTLYLRGSTLTDYDGERWSKERSASKLLRQTASKVFLSPIRFDGKLREYNIALEALDTEVVFTIAPWNVIELPKRFHSLWLDKYYSLRLPAKPFSKINYTLTVPDSFIDYIPERYDDIATEYAAMESSLEIDHHAGDIEDIRLLAREVTGGTIGSEQSARAIERYLKDNYTYTLNPERDTDNTPLDDFLFYAKEGYCQHYATAMAVMLRTIDIPSRIVTGFLGGEWNDFGKYYIVRQQDAHSWVEAYIEGKGWMRFDPTPAVSFDGAGGTSKIALYLDSLRWRWTSSVVNFNFSDQMDSTQRLAEGALTLKNRLRMAFNKVKSGDFKAPPSETITLIIALAFTGVLLSLLIKYLRRRRFEKSKKTPLFYKKFLALLKKRSLTKLPSETAMEFAVRTNIREAVEITKIYERVRYGRCRLKASDDKYSQLLLLQIKERGRKGRSEAL